MSINHPDNAVEFVKSGVCGSDMIQSLFLVNWIFADVWQGGIYCLLPSHTRNATNQNYLSKFHSKVSLNPDFIALVVICWHKGLEPAVLQTNAPAWWFLQTHLMVFGILKTIGEGLQRP